MPTRVISAQPRKKTLLNTLAVPLAITLAVALDAALTAAEVLSHLGAAARDERGHGVGAQPEALAPAPGKRMMLERMARSSSNHWVDGIRRRRVGGRRSVASSDRRSPGTGRQGTTGVCEI
jgi:hypothetical protein